jgi:hypothetical protein
MHKTYAQDVVFNILNNQVSDYDYSVWKNFTVEQQAECFREIVGIWASRSRDGRMVARIDIIDFMEKALLEAAKREGYE